MLPSATDYPREMDALRWAEHPAFYRPDYGRALTRVMPTLFELLGVPPNGGPSLAGVLPAASPRSAQKVLLVCIDAFGFKELAGSGRFKSLYPEYGTWITSVFPTITSCALSSLYQALPPARHGITGHVIWKDIPGAVVDMLRGHVIGAHASLEDAGFNLNGWKREPGLLDNPPGNGLNGYQILDRHIVGSGLSSFIYGQTSLVGSHGNVEALAKAGRILSDMERGWVGAYIHDLDTASHVMTGDSPESGLVVRHIEDALAHMAMTLPGDVARETAVMVVADHGQSNITQRIPLYGEPLEWLGAHTRAIGNSGRVMHVYLKAPDDEARVLAWLAEFIGNRGRVFPFEQAKGLTGPPLDSNTQDPEHDRWVRQSLGDLVVILEDGWNWEKRPPSPGSSSYESRLVSQHGALSWNEVFVPFLCAPLTALLEA